MAIAACGSIFFSLLFSATAGWAQTKPAKRLVDYVNPLIGSAAMLDPRYIGGNPAPGEELYTGTVNPGAMVPDPKGYVCVGPVTGYDGQKYHVRGSGYRNEDKTIMGFTNLNGEYNDANQILLMPTTGAIKTIPGTRDNPSIGYRSTKDAAREKASAGYYTVFLPTYGVKVELTATKSCGFHRYTFPASQQANILLDMANCMPKPTSGSVTVVDKHTIKGFQTIKGSNVYFYAVFNKDFAASGTWKDGMVSPGSPTAEGLPVGAYATFNTKAGEQILVKVGTSTISIDDAEKSLKEEIPGMNFNATRKQTEDLWTPILSRLLVEGGTEADKMIFYSSVYRTTRGPKYSWFPGNTIGAMILARGADWVTGRSAKQRGGWGGGYWGPGRSGGVVGLYKMGFKSDDIKAQYEQSREQALTGGGPAGDAYRKYGYIPEGAGVNDYVNRTIGQSYDDYAMAELAKIVGNTADYKMFKERAASYKKLFNPATGFFTPRKADGSWILPLDPIEPHAEDIYREGNAWNYLWFNIGDVSGLVDLLGGPKPFAAKLDEFFSTPFHPKMPLRDITGVVGLYIHGNEHYRHIPFLYNYVGQPWKTQAMVRKVQTDLYKPTADGLCGMDDYGCLCGWYVTSALGYYHIDHASDMYEIGSPLFPKVTVKIEGAKPGVFIIKANNVSTKNMYIQSATLNGKPLKVPRFSQNDMVAGGSLVYQMGPKPNYNWGTGK
jgi:putative alpha-1,2-mannosidase